MPAAPECAHLYPDGHHCRRVPARGESLCRDHRIPGQLITRQQDEEASHSEMVAFCHQLDGQSLTAILDTLSEAIAEMEPVRDNLRLPRSVRAAFARSTIAIVAALDASDAQDAILRAPAPGGTPQVPPLTSEQFHQLSDRLERLLSTSDPSRYPAPFPEFLDDLSEDESDA